MSSGSSCYNAHEGNAMVEDADTPLREKADPDAPPPVFGTWKRFYTIVIINTLVTYLFLLLFSNLSAR